MVSIQWWKPCNLPWYILVLSYRWIPLNIKQTLSLCVCVCVCVCVCACFPAGCEAEAGHHQSSSSERLWAAVMWSVWVCLWGRKCRGGHSEQCGSNTGREKSVGTRMNSHSSPSLAQFTPTITNSTTQTIETHRSSDVINTCCLDKQPEFINVRQLDNSSVYMNTV